MKTRIYGIYLMFLLCVVVFARRGSGNFRGIHYETRGKGRAVVLIHGGQMDRRMWDKLVSDIPGAEQKILPGAGHLVPMEKPAEFKRLAVDFLLGPTAKKTE